MKTSRTERTTIIVSVICAGLLLLAGAASSRAADGAWTNTASGSWSTAVNWDGGNVAGGSGSTARFTNDMPSDLTVTLDLAQTIGNLMIADADTNSTAGWTLSGADDNSHLLTLQSGTTPTITVSNLAGGKSANINARLAGTGFIKKGPETLILSGNNTNMSSAQLDEGMIKYNNANALGYTNNEVIFNGGTLWFPSATPALGITGVRVLTTGKIVSTNGNHDNFLATYGQFIGDSSAILYISSSNRFTPAGTGGGSPNLFTSYFGTIDLADSSSANLIRVNCGSTNIYDLSTVTLNGGTNQGRFGWRTTTANSIVRIGALTGAAGRLAASEQSTCPMLTWWIGYKNLDTTFGGSIQDYNTADRHGALTKVGTGKLTLTGTNTYGGVTVVTNGVLALSGGGVLTVSPMITVFNGATFDVSGLTAGTWTIGGTNPISSLTLAGNGTVAGTVGMTNGIISPGATNTGANVGTLTFANDLALGGTETNIFDIVSPAASDKIVVTGNLNLSSPTVLKLVPSAGNVIVTNGDYVLFQYGTLTGDWSNNIVLSYPLQLGSLFIDTNTSSQIVLRVTNATLIELTWRGDQGSDWSTALNWRDTNGAAATWVNGRVAHFDETAVNKTVNLSAAVSPARLLMTNSSDYVFNTTGGKITGAGVLVKDGSGKLILAAANDYAGSTTINAGTIQVGAGSTLGSLGNGSLIDNGTIAFCRSDDITYSGSISGTGGLAQNGPGKLTLTGVNTYTGPTVVSNGVTLQLGDGTVNGSVASTVLVSNTATLYYFFNNAGDAYVNNGLSGNGNVIYAMSQVSGVTCRTIQLTAAATNTAFTGSVDIKGGARLEITASNAVLGTNITVEFDQANDRPGALYVHAGTTYTNTQSVSIIGRGPGSDRTQGIDSPRGFGALRLNNAWAGPITITGVDPYSGQATTIGGSSGTGTILGNISDGGNGFPLEYFGGTIQVGPTTGVNSYGATLISEGLTGSGIGVSANTIVVALNTNAFSTNALHMVGQSTLRLNGHDLAFANLIDDSAASAVTNLYVPVVQNNSTTAPATITVGRDNGDSTFNGKFGNGASQPLNVTKVGSGNLTLSGDSTNTGTVRVSAGTLSLAAASGTYTIPGGSLTGSGSLSNATLITVDSGAILNVAGRSDGTLTLNSGQTLGGNGTVQGNVTNLAGSIINPGSSIGTLTLANNLTLKGTLMLELNRTNAQKNDLLTVSGTASYGSGTLAVSNIGPALQVGDSFTLFTGGKTFGSFNLQTNDTVNGKKYTWSNSVPSDGKITLTNIATLVNPNPTNIVAKVNGANLELSWPEDHTGWMLQAQTNNINVGLGTNWVDVSGSDLVNSVTNTINPDNGTVFYRMKLYQ